MPTGKPFPPTTASGNYVNRKPVAKNRILMKRKVRAFFKQTAKDLAPRLGALLGFQKMEDPKRRAKDAVDHLHINWVPLAKDVEEHIAGVAVAGGELSLKELGDDFYDRFGDHMRERARAYAEDRAAELVGMKREGEFYVPNPDAKWAIDDTTREMIKAYVTEAIENGDSTDDLADRLADSFAFSDSRAEMIARTETAKADSEGAVLGWKATGQVSGKSWLTAEDDLVSQECAANEDQGVVPLDYDYGDGVLAPPQHPNCRCTLLPELMEEMELPE